jgi:hypothetical protein
MTRLVVALALMGPPLACAGLDTADQDPPHSLAQGP